MSTRSCIARKTENGFKGTYHHWDGMPTCLGETLYNLYNGYFKKDLKKMLSFLIDEHPAGWSTINGADFSLPPGYEELSTLYKNWDKKGLMPERSKSPQCYCHGSRHEEANEINQNNASACGCEYAYVFNEEENKMYVLSSFHRDGNKSVGMFGFGDPKAIWKAIAIIELNEPAPDFEAIEKNATVAQRSIISFV